MPQGRDGRTAAALEVGSGIADGAQPRADNAMREMFGRGALFAAVWALQTAALVVVTPIVTRLLAPAGYGRYSLAITLVQLFTALASLGLQAGIQRVFVEDDGSIRSAELLGMSVMLTLAVTIGLEVTSGVWAGPVGLGGSDAFVELIVLLGGLGAVSQVALALIRSRDNLRAFSVVSLSQSLGAQCLGILLCLLVSRTATTYLVGMVIAQAAGFIIALLYTAPRPRGVTQVRHTLGVLKYSVPLMPQLIGAYVLSAGDRVVVQRDLGSAAVARYQIAYNVGSVAILILGVINQAWAPRFLAISDDTTRWDVLARLRDRVQTLVATLVICITMASPLALRVLAPRGYSSGQMTLTVALVAVSSFPYALYLSDVRSLIWFKRTGLLGLATAAAAVVNIVLNVYLVPAWGVKGSALATLLAYTMLAATTSAISKRSVRLAKVAVSVRILPAIAVGAAFASAQLPTTVFWNCVRVAAGLLAALAFIRLIMITTRSSA